MRGLAALLLLLLASPALAQPERGALRDARRAAEQQRAEAEAARREAREAAQEEMRLAQRRVEAARRVQAAEQRQAEAASHARAASQEAAAAQAEAEARAAALLPMLPLMRRLALWPAESLLAVPAPAEEALRGLLLLQGMSRQLAADAAALRDAQAAAARKAALAGREAASLAEAEAASRTAVAALEADLAQARERRAEARDSEAEAARRAAAAAGHAADLEAALARLEREEARERAKAERAARLQAEREAAARSSGREQLAAARQPAPEAPVPQARGGRAVPLAGTPVREFGATTETGPARGASWAAAPGARVVSPCGGRTVFAGPFRSYGLLLIVDCGEGYHFVLAGFERLDTAPGRRLLAGEPVGVLGQGTPGHRPTLYLELRRQGQPVDPRGWFAAQG